MALRICTHTVFLYCKTFLDKRRLIVNDTVLCEIIVYHTFLGSGNLLNLIFWIGEIWDETNLKKTRFFRPWSVYFLGLRYHNEYYSLAWVKS